MAGKERRGVSEADAALFEGRKYVLTPATRDERKSHGFEVLLDWIGRIGAVPVILDPDEHDRLVAFTSHMPQLLSTALGSVLSETPGVSQVAGPAVLELTRLAASSYDVWRDILITNEDHVREALKAVLIKLQYLHDNIGAEAIADEFSRAFDGARRVRGQESK
jgi:prephenate dehydrogenase